MSDIMAILPKPTPDSAPFWEACNREELLIASCEACDHRFYYPRRFCPKCGSGALGWAKAKGTGTVFSCSEVCISFYGSAWESQVPYTVVLVDLDEGPRMLSRMVRSPGRPIRTGDRIQVAFVEVDGQKLPYFRAS